MNNVDNVSVVWVYHWGFCVYPRSIKKESVVAVTNTVKHSSLACAMASSVYTR